MVVKAVHGDFSLAKWRRWLARPATPFVHAESVELTAEIGIAARHGLRGVSVVVRFDDAENTCEPPPNVVGVLPGVREQR